MLRKMFNAYGTKESRTCSVSNPSNTQGNTEIKKLKCLLNMKRNDCRQGQFDWPTVFVVVFVFLFVAFNTSPSK